QRLVGIGVAGEVRVCRDLPTGEVDRFEAGLDHLHGLAPGERAEGVHVVASLHEVPELFCSAPRERVFLLDPAPEPYDVLGRVRSFHPGPARVGRPVALDGSGGLGGGGDRRGGHGVLLRAKALLADTVRIFRCLSIFASFWRLFWPALLERSALLSLS